MQRPIQAAVALLLGATLINPAAAVPLRDGLGGVAGYGELSQGRNDDSSSNQLNLPFAVNFFGKTFDKFYVNNNGNISFGSPLSAYTPIKFPASTLPVIAPYWADVDTRGATNGAVYVGAANANAVTVTWNNVGYYNQQTNKLNDFQMTLVNRADTGAGNFDIEFRYNRLEWTTGSHPTSGGSNGLGGRPAQAGYDAGNGSNFFVLPGSFSNDVLNLVNTSNVSQETPGLWTMAIRNGGTSDGSSPDAPILPVIVNDEGFNFDFNVEIEETVFIDPEVATGYEYEVQSGPNITSVVLPSVAGDTDGYDIFSLADELLGHVNPGEVFRFVAGGVPGFRVLDIDIGAALDPNDPQAFVTGLTFGGQGRVQMTQKPITTNTDTSEVPEPGSFMLMGLGVAALAAARTRRRNAARA